MAEITTSADRPVQAPTPAAEPPKAQAEPPKPVPRPPVHSDLWYFVFGRDPE